MRKLLMVLAVGLIFQSGVLWAGLLNRALDVQDYHVYRNGDRVTLQLQGFEPEERLKAVTMVKENRPDAPSQIIENIHIEEYDFSLVPEGAEVSFYLDELDEYDARVEFIVGTDRAIYWSRRLIPVAGDLPENLSNVEIGTFTITDNDGGTFDPDDIITVDGSGFEANGTIWAQQFREFDGSGNYLDVYTNATNSTISIDGSGVLSGTAQRDGSDFNASTVYVRFYIVSGSGFDAVYSTNQLTVTETDPPDLIGAEATSLTTIKLTFNEAVQEVGGDAAAQFVLEGAGVGTASPSSLEPVGSEPTTTWTLNLSGSLGDRSAQNVTVRYDSSSSAGGSLQDVAGNEVKKIPSGSGIAVSDKIAPAAPTLVTPTDSTTFESGSVAWSATADDGTTDPSMSYIELQGSDDGSTWTNTGSQDTDVSDGNYSGSYALGTEYAYYRVKAVDNNGNVSYSSTTINYQNAHHIHITSAEVNEPVNTYQDEITFEIHDAYGNLENVTQTIGLQMTSGTGTATFRKTPGGSNITFINLSDESSSSFYFACDQPGTKTIKLGNAALYDASQNATITAGTASQLLVVLPGQTFVDGTGVTGDPDAQTAGSSFNIQLVITDANYFKVSETGSRDIDFSSTAGNAPDGTRPTINGVNSDSWSNMSINFTDGTSDNIPVVFYKSESGVTITASDDNGSPTLSGVASSGVTVNYGALDHFAFSMDSPQRDGYAVSGTNTITAQDAYDNTVLNFNASTDNVTITGSGPGTATITGLGSSSNNVLDQASDFSSGVADLTALGMTIDVTAVGSYDFTATASSGATGTASGISVNKVVNVSSPNTNADANIDASSSAGDLNVYASIDGTEDGTVSDDFRIKWGFNNTGNAGSYFATGQSTDLTPSGTISYSIPAASIQAGSSYDYFFWWVENISTNSSATIIEGLPSSSNPRRLVVNPTLITEAGVNGGDVSGGSYQVGVNDQEVVSIKFSSSPSVATIIINTLVFDKTGTASTNDISQFHLYKDGGTLGDRDSGDELLSSVDYSGGGAVTFSNISLSVTDANVYILVTVDIKSGADPNVTLGLKLTNESNISLDDNVLNGPATSINKQPFSNIGTTGDASLPVTLSSFEAESGYGKITLHWETASEIENQGFFIYRSLNEDGPYQVLNNQLIPGYGNSNTGHSYEYVDENVEEEMTYYYKLVSRDFNGTMHEYSAMASARVLPMPKQFTLHQNYPNPFNPTTHIKFEVARAGVVSLEIYNMLGQKIRTLISGEYLEPGVYDDLVWDATDDMGNHVANGIYYLVFKARDYNFRQIRKVVYMK